MFAVLLTKELMDLVCLPKSQVKPFPATLSWFQFITTCFIMQSLFLGSVETINCSQPTTKALLHALREEVLSYSDARPVISLKTPTNVTVDLTLYGILGVDEKSQVLETYLWVRLRWEIENLMWDPVECGTNKISLPREKMWVPDIVINEFMDENRAPETYYVYITNTGSVLDGAPFHVISSCKLDIYTFPFDIQNCSYTFNSYKHDVQDIQLFFFKPVEDIFKESLTTMATNGEWELVDMLAEKPVQLYIEGGWDNLIFYIVLRRRAALYVVNLLIPSCFLLSVDLFSFLLPPQSVDRASFKMTLILGYTVFLLLMNDLLPVTGNTLPLINVFFSLCMALMVASLLETILITNILCGSSNYRPLPKWIRILVLKYLARLLCMDSKSYYQNSDNEANQPDIIFYNKNITEIPEKKSISASPVSLGEQCLEEMKKMSKDLLAIRHKVDQHFNNDNNTDDWIHFGQVIDRLLFLLYFLFTTVSTVAILVLWLHWYGIDKSS